VAAEEFQRALPARPVKGKYGEPEHWDGFSTLFMVLARGKRDLARSEKGWLCALDASRVHSCS